MKNHTFFIMQGSLILVVIAILLVGAYCFTAERGHLSSSLPTYGLPVDAQPASESLFPIPRCRGFLLEEASIDDIQSQLSTGALTSVDLLHCFLERSFQTTNYLKYCSSWCEWWFNIF